MSAADLAAILRRHRTETDDGPAGVDEGCPALDASHVAEACEQGVGPLLYAALGEGGALDAQSPEVRTQLTRVARESVLVEAGLRRALDLALEAIHGDGVRPIVFKGAALAYTLYPQPWLRPRVDTDLLVRREQVEIVSRCLERLGYVVAARTSGELVTNQVTYEWPGDGVDRVFDIHWKIADPQVFADLFSYEDLEGEAVEVAAFGGRARAPCDSHALLVACAHRVAHHHDREILLFLYDIDRLARRLDPPAWDRVVAVAAAKGVRAVTARGLDLAARYFDTPVPASVRGALKARAGGEATARHLDPGLRKIDLLMSDFSRLGWRDRVKLVREHLVPPPSFVLRSYGRTRLLLLPLLYVHRIVCGASAWFRPLR